ncbi:MAG: HPP family protein [Gammaproteobacteria bacterium]
MEQLLKSWTELAGIEFSPVSHAERIVSGVGGFLGILGVFVVSRSAVGPVGAWFLVASMGASAVLLFAVPHGQLSQPWSVIGGHLISSIIGVTCAKLLHVEFVAAAAAVGLAIAAMHYLRCIHPPGGATALVAVVGGASTHALGYQYVLTPVMLNAFVILGVAIAFNYLFHWRRYPAALANGTDDDEEEFSSDEYGPVAHQDFVYALSKIDSFIDVSEHDLLRIYSLATGQARTRHLQAHRIELDRCYSNGEYGDDWSVRHVIDESPNADPDRDMVVYKVVAGLGRRTTGVATRTDFARWARHEVMRDEENWKRVATPTGDRGQPDPAEDAHTPIGSIQPVAGD